MSRQNIMPDFSKREFESFTDFSGGLNSEISNEKLKDTQSPVFQNIDISGNGSIKRRTGRVNLTSLTASYVQGLFVYRVRVNGALVPFLIVAADGKLYYKNMSTGVLTQLPILDTENSSTVVTFQTARQIEAQQYGDTMFFATGSFLAEVKFDGTTWTCKKVVAYLPTVQEVIYVGTNALAVDPNSYVQDGNPGTLKVVGIKIVDSVTGKPTTSGAVGRTLNLTAYITKINTTDSIEYQWEAKKSTDTDWPASPLQQYNVGSKSITYTPDTATDYDFRCTVRVSSTTTPTATLSVTQFTINNTYDAVASTVNTSGITTCNRIMLHYDRLLLAGDTKTPGQVYISDLTNPRYFPTNFTINFDTGKQEDITAIVRFQNDLVVFTTTSIQKLSGTSPDDYSRYLIHDGVGCTEGRTAKVMGNYIYFLSAEGIQALKPNQYKLETMNVARLDLPIKSEVQAIDTGMANAIAYDNQYWIIFPKAKTIYRYHLQFNSWVKDYSANLDIIQAALYSGVVYELTASGHINKHDSSVYNDAGEVYDMIIETKYYDFHASFNYKKLKKLYVLAKHNPDADINYRVIVYADSAIVLEPDQGYFDTVDGYTTWIPTNEPNMHFKTGTIFGLWDLGETPFGEVKLSVNKASVRGKCRRIKIRIRHSEDLACELYGFGFEFRISKV